MNSRAQASPPAVSTRSQPRYYRRFTPGQTLLHATVVSTFLGLAMTGLPLRFSGSPWAQGFARAVGGFGAILFFHKFCAVILTLAFLGHVGHVLYRGLILRERHFLGTHFDGATVEGRQGPIRELALVSGARRQTSV